MQTQQPSEAVWHILDAGSIWIKEFASALSRQVPTLGWVPEHGFLANWQDWEREEQIEDPDLHVIRFPLQRGYSRMPLQWMVGFGPREVRRLVRRTPAGGESVLVCTTPFYAPVAERWPGPVVYYLTDLTIAYDGVNKDLVHSMDKRMCQVASVVCPNSERIGSYLVEHCGCTPRKITVVPNATRSSNVMSAPSSSPGELPSAIASVPRPVAGAIGNLAGNLDWHLIEQAVQRTPEFSWVFVGPTGMAIQDRSQSDARARLMSASGSRVHFVGMQPYGALQQYARCFDVAVLPYCRREPTFSGSSTRFYEHLAACRPMVATRGFAELLQKRPLLQLVNTGAEMADRMQTLRAQQFRDGFEQERWLASKTGTWDERGRTIIDAVDRVRRKAPPDQRSMSAGPHTR